MAWVSVSLGGTALRYRRFLLEPLCLTQDLALDCISAAVLHRPRLSCLVTVALGLLTVILLSLVMYQQILYGGKYQLHLRLAFYFILQIKMTVDDRVLQNLLENAKASALLSTLYLNPNFP